jgi:MarR family transcriptional regulator for hemolysin
MRRDIAVGIGIEGATLTHHLTPHGKRRSRATERVADNRRNQQVTLTLGRSIVRDAPHVEMAFNQRLCAGLSERELATIRKLLARLRANAMVPSR